jgi:hypothetical protein
MDGSIYSRILFVDPKDGRRRTIRLGRVNKEQAHTFIDVSIDKVKVT